MTHTAPTHTAPTHTSPLGKYAQVVAAVISLGAVAAAVVSRPLGFADPFLDSIALVAVGAIFGNVAAVNGSKEPVNAAHLRLDALGAPPSGEAMRIMETIHPGPHEGPFTPTREDPA